MEYLDRIEQFIANVGFPAACVVAGFWMFHRSAIAVWCYFVPKSDAVIGAVTDFLKTTSSSVSKQTEILLVMSGVQREHGDILNQIIGRGEHDRHHQKLEDDDRRRDACSGCDSVPSQHCH